MCKMAATIIMASLPNPATEENIMKVCESVKRSLDIYMEQTNIFVRLLSFGIDKDRCSINGRFLFETKKDCNQFIKSLTNNKSRVLSCFPYEVIENEKTN